MNIKKILLTALSISLLTPTASSYVATEKDSPASRDMEFKRYLEESVEEAKRQIEVVEYLLTYTQKTVEKVRDKLIYMIGVQKLNIELAEDLLEIIYG